MANEVARTSAKFFDPKGNPGPYVAIVRNHLDSKYMGTLEVEILFSSESGNSPNSPGRLAQARYLSPFYGTTSYDGLTKNTGYKFTQKSYGWWMVPPDVGSRVLVLFAEGNRGQGFWIGCVQDDYMNFMVPGGNPATNYNNQDNTVKLPVGEYNKKTESAVGRDPTRYIKPVNTDYLNILDLQGLSEDETRGITSSSARREVPSTVFGFSTPGPQDRRSGTPGIKYGENFAQSQTAFNRLGGSTFVMDDGDATLLRKGKATDSPMKYSNKETGETGGDPTLPHNELVRLKTRTGHQILLHNTEDLIYIANANGTTWIELTANGKIDIYAQDSISIHSEKDLNFRADRDINIEAGRDFNVKALKNIKMESVENYQLYVTKDKLVKVLGNDENKVMGDKRTTARGNIVEHATEIHMNSESQTEAEAAQELEVFQTFDLPNPYLWSEEDGEYDSTDREKFLSMMKRVPMHEPWGHHENLDPTAVTSLKTDITLDPTLTNEELQELVDEQAAAEEEAAALAAEEALQAEDDALQSEEEPADEPEVVKEPIIMEPTWLTQTPDTFRKAATPTPQKEKAAPSNTSDAPADSGVIKTKEEAGSAAEPPAEVSAAADAVKTDLSVNTVSALDSAIDTAVAGAKMGFAAAQTLVKDLDKTFNPSALKTIVEQGAEVFNAGQVAASSALLDVRTKLAKINTSNSSTTTQVASTAGKEWDDNLGDYI